MAQEIKKRAIKKKEQPAVPLVPKYSVREADEKMEKFMKHYERFSNRDRLKLLRDLGVGDEYFTCDLCGEVKNAEDFYMSTDPMVKFGRTPVCKECAYDIALRKDANGQTYEPTIESVKLALERIDKPFLDSVWESSIVEANGRDGNSKTKNNVWTAYIKNVSMINYQSMRWKDGDIYKDIATYNPETVQIKRNPVDELTETFEQNKKDVIRILGYEPFERERLSDQPFLYSQLLGMLDRSEDANDDMMRTASAITIVRSFLQMTQIDDKIAELMQNSYDIAKNVATLKSLQSIRSLLAQTVQKLAAESCISLKNSKDAKKGENTWTGKIKKLKEMNLREQEVNGFDIGTCKGMRQVADISHASIMRQIKLDENDYTEMLARQKELIEKYIKASEIWQERARILLRENIDLKRFLDEKGLLDPSMMIEEEALVNDYEETYYDEVLDSILEEKDEESNTPIEKQPEPEQDDLDTLIEITLKEVEEENGDADG